MGTAILMAYLFIEKDNLIMDKALEHKLIFKDIKELMEKEQCTGAYNEIVFDDFIDKEITRAQRYNYQFALVAFRAQGDDLLTIHKKLIRKSDYFGKINSQNYAILLTHCNINDALIFTNKIKPYTCQTHISVAEYMPGDTKEILCEKLTKALRDKRRVDIEV
eukprot:NODE_1750_length_549_cov_775.412000_g1414_i0.p1 GENE.NODE_1750_length_549_cov_775.412000_g1414_i0~~NODE_1750_length_549_cov_775.412000_g1414_i0.p1  ORF type:complete len:163 (-),score=2.12 NODE_1750_length_549_cov_775.412000_g1414_i0:31-519(-)